MAMVFHVDDRQVTDLMEQLARSGRDVRPALDRIGHHMVRTSIPQNFQRGGRPEKWEEAGGGRPGRTLYRRGRLAGSVAFRVVYGRMLKVGSRHKGAALHQFGGTVKPKHAKALTVPLPGVLASARRYRNTFFLPKPEGEKVGVIIQRQGRRSRVLFVLMKSVTIPQRVWLLWQDEDVTLAEHTLLEHLGVTP